MAVSSLAVANAFLALAKKSGRPLTNLQLQQLAYFAHGFMLAVHDRPLYTEQTRAWHFGPVIPDLHEALRRYGREVIEEDLKTSDSLSENDKQEMEIIKDVWEGYGHLSGPHLSRLTKKRTTPWPIAWKLKEFGVIENDLMRVCFKSLLAEV